MKRPRFNVIAIAAIAVAAASGLARAKRQRTAPIWAAAPVADPTDAAVAPPAANDVCFSPEERCDLKLLKFIQGAVTSLDVAIYDLNLDQIVHHLALKARQIRVRVVVDQRQAHGEHSAVMALAKLGVEVRFGRQRGIMHNKFTVRDETAVETGSFNYTHHAAMANNENQIYLTTPEVVRRYRDRFAEIWAAAVPVAAH